MGKIKDLFNKVTGIEAVRDIKADKEMTYHQSMASIHRKEYVDERKKTKFDGHITKIERQGNSCSFEGENAGHKIEGTFHFKTCNEGCCWGSPDSATLIIDGESVSEDAAMLFAKENQELLYSKTKEEEHAERAPQSVHEAAERRKFHEAKQAGQEAEKTRKAIEEEEQKKLEKEKIDRARAELEKTFSKQ